MTIRREQPRGAPIDCYAPQRERGSLAAMGTIACQEGPNHLMFKLVGKNEQSSGLAFDLISIQCERVE